MTLNWERRRKKKEFNPIENVKSSLNSVQTISIKCNWKSIKCRYYNISMSYTRIYIHINVASYNAIKVSLLMLFWKPNQFESKQKWIKEKKKWKIVQMIRTQIQYKAIKYTYIYSIFETTIFKYVKIRSVSMHLFFFFFKKKCLSMLYKIITFCYGILLNIQYWPMQMEFIIHF